MRASDLGDIGYFGYFIIYAPNSSAISLLTLCPLLRNAMSDPISSQGTYTKFRVRTNAADNESFAGQSTRKRAIRSCITCYRAKVRCDRRHPCERYTASGAAEQCTYMDDSRPGPTPWETPSHPAKEKDLVRAPEYKMYYFTGSTTTRTGLSHWASVINEVRMNQCCVSQF